MQVGDIVQLKGGGGRYTLESLDGGKAIVSWNDKNNGNRQRTEMQTSDLELFSAVDALAKAREATGSGDRLTPEQMADPAHKIENAPPEIKQVVAFMNKGLEDGSLKAGDIVEFNNGPPTIIALGAPPPADVDAPPQPAEQPLIEEELLGLEVIAKDAVDNQGSLTSSPLTEDEKQVLAEVGYPESEQNDE